MIGLFLSAVAITTGIIVAVVFWRIILLLSVVAGILFAGYFGFVLIDAGIKTHGWTQPYYDPALKGTVYGQPTVATAPPVKYTRVEDVPHYLKDKFIEGWLSADPNGLEAATEAWDKAHPNAFDYVNKPGETPRTAFDPTPTPAPLPDYAQKSLKYMDQFIKGH